MTDFQDALAAEFDRATVDQRAEDMTPIFPSRYEEGYAKGFAGAVIPPYHPDRRVGWVDGRNAALAILHEDELR